MNYTKLLFFLIFSFFAAIELAAQDSCPCENCPEPILDATFIHEFRLNIFNVQNNNLANSNQCVSRVGVKFKHTYLGDVTMELISPGGDTVLLLGPVTFSLGTNGQTDNILFDVSFVPTSEVAEPEFGFSAKWDNEQNWITFGARRGSYYPFRGNLEDFDQGRVNGTWILRVTDFVSPDPSFPNDKTDEGELIDFYVEFCDSDGLVCDPCLDPEDTPDCIFMVDAAEETAVPDEVFCLPIYAKNVAFLRDMQFDMHWDPSILEFTGLDSFKIEFLEETDFNTADVRRGNLSVAYNHTFDNLGLVVKDSTAIFQVCFKALGNVGDSTIINFPSIPVAIDVDGINLMTSAMEGIVRISVDSTADCVRAIQLCDNSPISEEKSRGPGFEEFEASNCFLLGEEHQSKWYKFDILQTGSLEFVIRPKEDASYGFAIYKGACPNSADSEIMACEAGFPLITRAIGVSDNPQGSFGEIDNTSFQPNIDATEAETYYLLIDNFSNDGTGFEVEFAGTAIIGDYTLQTKIEDPATITCNQTTIQLDARNSTQGPQYIPEWSTDTGQINTTTGVFEPLILKGGSFTLKIKDSQTGCVSEKNIYVPTDQVFPNAEAGGGTTLDCNRPTFELTSLGSSSGVGFSIEWSTADGKIDSSPTEEEIVVSAGGLYIVEIENSENGCVSSDEVVVSSEFENPQLTAADNAISCRAPIAELRAISSTDNVTFEWQGEHLPIPKIDASISVTDTGFYLLTITAPNGCTTSDSVFVSDDRVFPVAEAGENLTLNCELAIQSLNGNGSSEGARYNYLWTTADGNFVSDSDQTTLFPMVDSGGIFQIEVTDATNGCVTIDSVFIDTSFNVPDIQIETDTVLNCYQPTIIIDASKSDSGSIYEFDWFLIDGEGNIADAEDTYHPIIDEAGGYFFKIKNTENGCVSTSAFITITADNQPPSANAGEEETLNCTRRILILDGKDSSKGGEITYKWDSDDGHFTEDTDSIRTKIDSAGIYTLKVIDISNGCESIASVKISKDFAIPNLSVSNDSTLTCVVPTILLKAISITANTTFEWILLNSEKIEGASISIKEAGVFLATVTAANGCTNTDFVTIDSKQEFPKISINKPKTITCEDNVIALNAAESDDGGEFDPFWSTTDGHFVNESERSKLNPGIDKGGTYVLEITNIKTGCTAVDSVFAPSSVDPPSIDFLNIPDTLTCANTTVSVEAFSNAPNASFQWKSEQTILSNESLLSVDVPGSYNIIVINPQNNCSSRTTIEIEIDTIMPIVDAGETMELNCTIGEVILDGTNSSKGENFQYLWTTQGSQDFSDSLIAIVDKPGLYTLIVLDRNNGCRTTDTIRVTESTQNPIADAGKDTIYCRDAEELAFVLGGAATSKGVNFSYSWQDIKGNQLGNEFNQLVHNVDTFILEVANIENNCVITDTVEVVEKNRPTVFLESSGGINCSENEIIYIATTDFSTANIQWLGDGMIINDSVLIVTDELIGKEFIAFAIDNITGCKDESSIVSVTSDRLPPIVNAGKDAKLNCSDTLNLDGEILSQDFNTSITWRTEDGNIVSEKNILNPIVDAAGTYILNIENKDNFCHSEDTLIVETNQVLPIIELAKDTILTCFEPEIILRPNDISSGGNFYYEWRDGDNKLLAITKELTVTFPDTYQLKVIDSFNLCANFNKIIVSDSLNPPIIIIDQPEIISCLNNEVELNAIIGVEDGSFEWTVVSETGNILGEATRKNVRVNAAGVYQMEAINTVSGCSGIKTIQVSDIREEILIESGEDKILTCYNDSLIVLTGTIFSDTENLAFEWTSSLPNFTPIDTSLILNIKEPGFYIFSVVDTISGCQSIDTVVVDENTEAIVYEIGEDQLLDCEIKEVKIGDAINAGLAEYNYEWESQGGNIRSGVNESIAVVDKEGLYSISIINTTNGCTFFDSLRIVENKILPTVDVGEAKVLTCIENEAILGGLNTSKGVQYRYQWITIGGEIIDGANTPFATINLPGLYELAITDTINHCTQSEIINITVDKIFPKFNLPEGLSYSCTDETISISPITEIDIEFLDFVWFTNNGSIASTEGGMTIEVTAPGKYFIRVGDRRNSCITLDSVVVADNRTLPAVAELSDRMLSCTNESITLSAIGSAIGSEIEYKWLNESNVTLSNSTTVTLEDPGQYILQVFNKENGCSNSDTVVISENFDPPSGGDFIIESPACNGINNGLIEIEKVLDGTPPYEYELDIIDRRRDPFFLDLAPDDYHLTIIDELGCEWDTIIHLDQPDMIELELQLSDNNIVTNEVVTFSINSNIPESEIISVIWTPEELFDCLDCIEQTTALVTSTKVEVVIIDENGCSGTVSLDVVVNLATIPNAITPNGDGLNDVFIIPAIEADPFAFPDNELIIFNRWNDVLYRSSPYNNDWNGKRSNGQKIPQGTYYYVLRLDVREGEAMKGEITILRRE